jgi:hypothetical protein
MRQLGRCDRNCENKEIIMIYVKRVFLSVFVAVCLISSLQAQQNSLTLVNQIVEAESGTTQVSMPVLMTSTTDERHAISLAIVYDTSKATLDSISRGSDTMNAEWSAGTICNSTVPADCDSAGGVLWSIIMGLTDIAFDPDSEVGPGSDLEVAVLNFTVSLAPGESTDISFQDGLDLFGVSGKNALVREGTRVESPNLGLERGTISISEPADPVGQFRRGDCDQSGEVDFNDAIFHLKYLFLGENGEVVDTCRDACDSNDSGDDNFSDDIGTLKYLFLGTSVIPAPGVDSCGLDPTEGSNGDIRTCETYAPTVPCP